MPKIIRIIGGPGAGKTEYLMRQVERACEKYFEKDIGFVSHTTAAVSEARARIQNKLNVSYEKIKNVKTIHSHCFNLLGIKKEDIMETSKNIKDFNEQYPAYAISPRGIGNASNDENDGPGSRLGINNQIFNAMQINRNMMIEESHWPAASLDFKKVWFDFMENEGKVDFTKMLEQCLDRELSPDIKVLICDEAQDLPKIQVALINQWGEICDTVLWAGDANQAIFGFAGSDPGNFMGLKADKVIALKQSYRLSPVVLAESLRIIQQANIKEIVEFHPTDKYGEGSVFKARLPDFSLQGSHMLLCRCKFQLQKHIDLLLKNNIPFHNEYRLDDKCWNPLSTSGAESIKVYLKILRGEQVDIYEIKQMVKNCVAKECLVHGAKKTIDGMPLTKKKTYEFFGLIKMGFLGSFLDQDNDMRKYFRLKLQSQDMIFSLAENTPEKLFEKPKICLGTIHSVKGGEADTVWLDPSITTKIKKALAEKGGWDEEARVAYVGVTRARSNVGILPAHGYRNPFLQ